MKKIFSLAICLLCVSYAYCQKGKVVDIEQIKTTYNSERNHDNAVAYMSALEKVGGKEAEILVVLDTLFRKDAIEKFSNKSWYFFDRYVNDLDSPLMKNILIDKYWANRFWTSEKINRKITKMSMELVADIYDNKNPKYTKEYLENYVTILNSFDLSEFEYLGLCSYLIKLRLDENYSYAISVLEFAIPNYGNQEWVNMLYGMMMNCAKMSKESKEDVQRVNDYLDKKVIDYYMSADRYNKLATTINQK